MKQIIEKYKEKMTSFWSTKSNAQKRIYIGSILLCLIILIGGSYLLNRTSMVPLYNNLSLQEVGQIKAELDSRGVKYELDAAGTTIKVPSEQVDTLLVDLAAQGIPNSGNIDYSFFSANTSWGMTDSEFEMIQLDAMQTELSNLITTIEGIEGAEVMINKPQDPVFVSDQAMDSSAAIMLRTRPGYQFDDSQINALYHLVSKTVPNLPTDNIVIMDQNFNYFDLNNSNSFSSGDAYAFQQNVKKDIERDLTRRVQQMVGMMVGQDKVVASVTADVDFTQEKRMEEIVEPVNEEDVEGLPVSIETIRETYTGNRPETGEVGTGEGDVPNYPAGDETNDGSYEMVKESINNEFSRIHKEISESPYKIRDLGIQVAVDNTKETAEDDEEVQYLSQQEQNTVEEGIASILNSIVTTTVDKGYGEVNPEEKVSIVFQEFNGKPSSPPVVTGPAIPYWVYALGVILLIIIIALIVALTRKRNKAEDYMNVTEEMEHEREIEIPEIEGQENESTVRRKQLEKLAKEKPEEFAKLLRSWIAED